MTDLAKKSQFEAEIKKLEEAKLITMPKSLDELLKDEKFADFKRDYDSSLGKYRTTWEKELEEKSKKAAPPAPGTEPKPDEFQAKVMEMFDNLQKNLNALQQKNTIDSLSTYAKEKAKDLPAEFQQLIHITDGMTQADIDKQVNLLTTAKAKVIESIDGAPFIGQAKTEQANVDSWKQSLPPIDKKND